VSSVKYDVVDRILWANEIVRARVGRQVMIFPSAVIRPYQYLYSTVPSEGKGSEHTDGIRSTVYRQLTVHYTAVAVI
jgi:hypothetical protein